MKYELDSFTYGAELELADIDINLSNELPEGCAWDRKDYTMVNSNGIAVDPKGVSWRRGGEINTAPTDTILEQVEQFGTIVELFPEIAVNYRSNLHIHIGVPGLRGDLKTLKNLQKYISVQLPQVLPLLEPIPKPTEEEYPDEEAFKGAKKRWRRRRRSHQTILSKKRVEAQLGAETLSEFFDLEPPQSKAGKPLWVMQPRAAVNVRQLLETKTIEFRHFPGTLDSEEFHSALYWCREFLWAALNLKSIVPIWYSIGKGMKIPKFEPYVHEMELRYLKTCHDGSNKRETIEKNIKKILEEDDDN